MYSDFFLSKISSKQKIEENVNQLLELVRTHLLNEVELELIFFSADIDTASVKIFPKVKFEHILVHITEEGHFQNSYKLIIYVLNFFSNLVKNDVI